MLANLNLATIKLLSALLIFAMAIIAGWFPMKKNAQLVTTNYVPISEALASGIFLGVGLIHMMADANSAFIAAGVHYPFAFLLAGIIFLLLLLFEHIGMELDQHGERHQPAIALIAVFMLSLHSLFEGAALGVTQSLADLTLIFIAIVAHKWAASFSLMVKLKNTSLSFKGVIGYFLLFASMTPIGILLATSLTPYGQNHALVLPIINSMSAGAFIYIGTLHGLKRSVMIERCCNVKEFIWLVIGFLVMAMFAIWETQIEHIIH